MAVKQILQEFEHDSNTPPTLSACGEVISNEENVSKIVEEPKTNKFLLHTSGVQKHTTRDVEFEKKNAQMAVIIDHLIRDLWNSYDHSSTLSLAFLADLPPQNGVDAIFDAIRCVKQVTANISSPIVPTSTASSSCYFALECFETLQKWVRHSSIAYRRISCSILYGAVDVVKRVVGLWERDITFFMDRWTHMVCIARIPCRDPWRSDNIKLLISAISSLN